MTGPRKVPNSVRAIPAMSTEGSRLRHARKVLEPITVTKIKSVGHDKEDAFKTLVLADTQKHWSNPW
jgi:hypothetical protein